MKNKKGILNSLTSKAIKLTTTLSKNVDLILMGISLSICLVLGHATYEVLTTPTNQSLESKSVMITRPDGRSGGSGVILSSSTSSSLILTNSHVCGVVEHGGTVSRGSESHIVTSYRRSAQHDLCLITVAGDFGVSTKLAKEAPGLGDQSIVVGHPQLLPTIITRGHFTDHKVVSVLTKMRECTEDDLKKNPDNALLCMFLGGIPTVTRYEGQIVTSLIQPGSSGSPVFNKDGELSGLVFAGSGELSYGIIVPYEFVANFLTGNEAYTRTVSIPNEDTELTATELMRDSVSLYSDDMQGRFKTLCSSKEANSSQRIQEICRIASRDMLWRR